MKLKGIELKGTYRVEFSDTWFEVYDEKDNRVYFEDSTGLWEKSDYDENGNEIYYEDMRGYWAKWEYNEKNNEIYFEDRSGEINDRRVKELTIEEIEKLLGYKIKIKGE